MRYTSSINNQKSIEWGLTLSQAILFDLLNQLSSWASCEFISGKNFYHLSRSKVVEEIPLAYQKEDTVYRALKEFENLELIELVKFGSKDMVRLTQKGCEWNYFDNSEKNPTLGKKSDTRKKIRDNSEKNPSAYIDNNNTSDNIYKNKNINIFTKMENLEKDFDEFWNEYPKTRAGSKEKAFKAYILALKNKKTTHEELIKSVRAYSKSKEVSEGYAKGCQAWINDDRFLCDYSEIKNIRNNKNNVKYAEMIDYNAFVRGEI